MNKNEIKDFLKNYDIDYKFFDKEKYLSLTKIFNSIFSNNCLGYFFNIYFSRSV